MGWKNQVINDIVCPWYTGEWAQASGKRGDKLLYFVRHRLWRNHIHILTPPFLLKYRDQHCPIERECKPQMRPTYVILNFVIATWKRNMKLILVFSLSQYIQNIISTCNQYKNWYDSFYISHYYAFFCNHWNITHHI